jgi:hypothetical protein
MAWLRGKWWKWMPVGAGALALWVGIDLAIPVHNDIRRFDGAAVGHLEADMWRSYYEHRPLRLLRQMHELLEKQFGLPYWRAWLGAFRATRAAVVFQRGHNRGEYLLAMGDLDRYYGLIRRASTEDFDVSRVAALELEWWIVHRERASHPPDDLATALAGLQAAMYNQPPSDFAEHAKARADAMLIRDSSAANGATSEADWRRIEELLVRSWRSAERAVAR